MAVAEETKVIRIIVDSSRAVDGSAAATRAWERMEKAQDAAAGSMARMERSLGNIGTLIGTQVGLLIGGLVARFVDLAKGAFDVASGIGELAEQLGLTAKGLQGLQFAAVQGGVKMEQLEAGVSIFSRRLGEAAEGSKVAIAAFDAVGVKVLDAQGKLRSTEQVMQNVAARILAIEDPARRAAVAADLFGRSGARLMPILPDIARGFGEMAEGARRAGAVISDEAIAKLDKLADSGARTRMIVQAVFAETAAGPLTDTLDFINRKVENLLTLLKTAANNLTALLSMAANPGAFLAQAFLPTSSEKLASDIERQRKAIEAGEQALAQLGPNDSRRKYTQTSVDRARAELARLEREQGVAAVGGRAGVPLPGDPDNIGISVVREGAKQATASDAGKSAEDAAAKYAKLMRQLDETARAQGLMTKAARDGDVAFEAQKVHLDAVQKTMEIFGRRLDDNDPKLVKVEERLRAIAQGKVAEAFATATTQLEQQSELLEVEIRLIGELPEIRAQELAIIKAKHEAEKAGSALTAEDVERRRAAIEANERLKIQAEELRRAQELWTEPLKQALRDIQSTAADAFEQMLESGKFNFEELGKVFKKIITRMIAEFLALATIRPVMSVVVNAISPSIAQQMGLGAGASALSLPGIGGGGMPMPSMGGGMFSGGLGGLGDWLNTPFTGPYAGMSPSSMAGVPTLSPSMWNPSTWSITPLQGIGAAAGVGSGIFSLMTGGGSTRSTITGVSQIAGGLASLIPGVGPILGPLIGIGGSLLGGLFGEPDPVVTNQTAGQLSFGRNGFFTTGGAWGPTANASSAQGPLAQAGNSIQAIFDALGGVRDPGRVWGLSSESISRQGGGWDFSSTSTFLQSPDGGRELWRMNMDDMMNTGAAQVAVRSIIGGAVGEITDNMRAALESIRYDMGLTLETVGTAVAEINAFDTAIDNLGRTVSPIGQALAEVEGQFAALYATASKYGLGTGAIDAALTEARLKVVGDFDTSLRLATLDLTDPTQAAWERLDVERKDLVAQNDDIVEVFGESATRIVQIEEYLAAKRVSIAEQAGQEMRRAMEQTLSTALGGIGRLQDLVRELSPGGGLANLDPAGQYAGLRATYGAAYAQAQANPTDAALLDRSVAAGREFAEYSQRYYAGSPDYNRDRDMILRQAQSLQLAAAQQAPAVAGAGVDPQMTQLFQQLAHAIAAASAAGGNQPAMAQLLAKIDQVMNLLINYIANGKRAA